MTPSQSASHPAKPFQAKRIDFFTAGQSDFSIRRSPLIRHSR